MNRVSIIGFGRFGTMLHQLLIKGFEVDVYDIEPVSQSDINFVSLDDVLKNDTIFIAVPIRDFEGLMSSLSTQISGKKNYNRCLFR
jgi:prephenate dehydrogenase